MFIAFSTLLASAQFMATSTVMAPADSANWGIDNFTNNIGIAYKINDNRKSTLQWFLVRRF